MALIKDIKHQPWLAYLIILDGCTLMLVIFFNVMALGPGVHIGMFKNTTREISEEYSLDITLPGWTDVLLLLVFIWNGTFIIYSTSNICRRGFGLFIYIALSDVLTPFFYTTFLFAMLTNIGWVFAWCYHILPLAFVFNVAQTTLLCVALLAVHRCLHTHVTRMSGSQIHDVWLIRILVHNGIAIWTQWIFVNMLINLAQVMTYSGSVHQDIASTVSLTLFTMDTIGWFLAENSVLEKYVRFTASNYIINITATAAIVAKNCDMGNFSSRNSIFALAVSIMCALMVVCKLVLALWRHRQGSDSQYDRIMPSTATNSNIVITIPE
ncbi:uncharacterized protein [Ptychodera flava]|uniref:uncharacterized protein n=1 Tax=Ptychodera flava TaxID=63121 RepID=UPI00396A3CC7